MASFNFLGIFSVFHIFEKISEFSVLQISNAVVVLDLTEIFFLQPQDGFFTGPTVYTVYSWLFPVGKLMGTFYEL